MKLTTLAVLLTLAILGGCGQTGPLYIPGDPASVSPPPATPDNDDENNDEEERRQ